ncbi:MAG: YfiR family protein [Bacteroidales bacterium]|jgi:hypothetical protein|nr:YfiR family protein [Bacteroidales bacterium]
MRNLKVVYLSFIFSVIFTFNLEAQEEKYIGLFLYNFTKYFDWPETVKSGDFVIEVLGHKSVYDELLRITANKKIGNQNIVVKNPETPEAIGKCHIMFVGHWHSRHLPVILNKLSNHPSLIITEMEGLLDQGSAINFVIRDGTIKFEMKISNVNSHNIKTDQRIRELAYKVID